MKCWWNECRYKSMESIKINKNESGSGSVHREVFCSKKSARKFSWMKLGWKRSEEDECVVCLEEFKRGDILVHLPCLHRFHWTCVVPWIEANSHCPCCRTSVSLASLESCWAYFILFYFFFVWILTNNIYQECFFCSFYGWINYWIVRVKLMFLSKGEWEEVCVIHWRVPWNKEKWHGFLHVTPSLYFF